MLSLFTKKAKVLFHRDYLRFQGGHLKVWHYYNHLKNSKKYESKIYFTKQSIFDDGNPWKDTVVLRDWEPSKADVLFLAGLDWQAVLNSQLFLNKKNTLPVINLIQGLSHAEVNDVKYSFLKEKAIRICVSKDVAEAIQSTGQINGPLFTIPNGLDLENLPTPLAIESKDIDLLIVAIKKPDLGIALEQKLNKSFKKIITITHLLPRADFLSLINRCKVCLCLPHFAEGFYLPALEAMALGALVICPDCIGNRSFCFDGENCFCPAYDEVSIIAAAQRAATLSSNERFKFIQNSKQTVNKHSMQHEASQFLDIMSNIKNLW